MKITVQQLGKNLGGRPVLQNVTLDIPENKTLGMTRSQRQRQIHPAALHLPGAAAGRRNGFAG